MPSAEQSEALKASHEGEQAHSSKQRPLCTGASKRRPRAPKVPKLVAFRVPACFVTAGERLHQAHEQQLR
jgi:hypothetical protein